MKMILEREIRTVLEALQKAGALPPFPLPEILVERPKEDQFGEYSSNVALMLAKQAKKNPMELAQIIESGILNLESGNKNEIIEKIEVASPGYINFYLSQKALGAVVEEVLVKKDRYGAGEIGKGVKVNNEFISANPTGPLHLGNGRGGFYADVLSRVLRKVGYDVVNEYYVNDAGEQILKLGHSVLKDSEVVYEGNYVDALHQRIMNHESGITEESDSKEAGAWAAQEILENMIKKTVEQAMHISFDVWTSERKLFEDGLVDEAIEKLKSAGMTFENEGALWLKTSEQGDDKDRVLIKADGKKTYLASDAGHILSYLKSKVDTILETFGADHHGYTKRFEIVARALGFTGEIHFTLVQLVKVVKDGEEVRMSKRAGNVITIDELIEKVGHDVARFFFLLYAPETQMNFDLGLAEEHSEKNPVFYVQYAHARLASILRKAEEEGFTKNGGDLNLLVHPKERGLIRELMFFPELIETIARDFSVHRLPQYAIRLADKLHSFYADCRVLDEEDKPLTYARLELISAVKIVLAETLHVMGITAPEKM
ncbi:MAG: arginine--tRNA ligase [Candidatus Moranbacteria bacterium]|nr:arginine--tRNA ligase [Candidatus Moranbacteria bacterium]